MARVALVKPDKVEDPVIRGIFDWVTRMEGAVPNHFYVEMNFPELFKAKLSCSRVLWEMGELTPEEIQYVGIAVSKANGCPYCTAAFCTILNHGLGTDEAVVKDFTVRLEESLNSERAKTLVRFALKFNADARSIADGDIASLRHVGLTDKGIVQLCHLVSDFASYNRLNLALDTDYDYRDLWRDLAFGLRAGAEHRAG
jgi:uncharacterized peroxidase-related enzyme